MHAALVALSIWIAPGFLFVAWRLWIHARCETYITERDGDTPTRLFTTCAGKPSCFVTGHFKTKTAPVRRRLSHSESIAPAQQSWDWIHRANARPRF